LTPTRRRRAHRLKPLPDGFQAGLHGEEAKGTWQLRTRGDVLETRIEQARAWGDQPVELCLPLPLSAAIELPVDHTAC
jgi:hypothetical protein